MKGPVFLLVCPPPFPNDSRLVVAAQSSAEGFIPPPLGRSTASEVSPLACVGSCPRGRKLIRGRRDTIARCRVRQDVSFEHWHDHGLVYPGLLDLRMLIQSDEIKKEFHMFRSWGQALVNREGNNFLAHSQSGE